MWIAWAGVLMFWVAGISWMMGFGRIVNLTSEDRNDFPMRSLHYLSVGLCITAVASFVISVMLVFYGVWVWIG